MDKHIGERFSRLKIISFSHRNGQNVYYNVICDCGTIKKVRYSHMSSKASDKTRSCGCLAREITSQRSATHKMSKTRIYEIWHSILKRCNNPATHLYHRYGGRGIKLIWKSFEDFKKDMYRSYLNHVKKYGEKETTIDRINSDGHYSKNNCRWASYKEQANNRTSNILYSYKGTKKTLSQWADIVGVTYHTLWARVKANWPIEKALEKRTRRYK